MAETNLSRIRAHTLKNLAKKLRRPFSTLFALAYHNDPFLADVPFREANAKWAAAIWRKIGFTTGIHTRRIHYRLTVAREKGDKPWKMPNGDDYLNTLECWDVLTLAVRDARYLGFISADDMVDRRNAEPMIYRHNSMESDASIYAIAGGVTAATAMELDLPCLCVVKPVIAQPYHLEIWCEKSTVNDILLPLGERYGVNICTAIGEMSYTRCVEAVRRAVASERPVRILYLSDFDPAGMSMPVAASRKIEFVLHNEKLRDADIQVRPIALTHDQCEMFLLPRTPIKDSERRATKFEERFGEGATELDALEAIRPGQLERMLIKEIERYYDYGLEEIDSVARQADNDLVRVTERVHRQHRRDIAKLESERKKIAKLIAAAEKRTRPIINRIERDLYAVAPEPDSYPWPQPRDDADEDDDPLFDSTRDYVEQINRYKEHQGKPTERQPRRKRNGTP